MWGEVNCFICFVVIASLCERQRVTSDSVEIAMIDKSKRRAKREKQPAKSIRCGTFWPSQLPDFYDFFCFSRFQHSKSVYGRWFCGDCAAHNQNSLKFQASNSFIITRPVNHNNDDDEKNVEFRMLSCYSANERWHEAKMRRTVSQSSGLLLMMWVCMFFGALLCSWSWNHTRSLEASRRNMNPSVIIHDADTAFNLVRK